MRLQSTCEESQLDIRPFLVKISNIKNPTCQIYSVENGVDPIVKA